MEAKIWFRTVAVFFLWCGLLFSQDNPNTESGLKPYGSFHGGDIDSISLTSGNVMLHIPLLSYPQRGSDLRAGFFLELSSKASWHVERNGTNAQNYTYHWVWGGAKGISPGVTLAMDQGISVSRTRTVTDWTDHPDWDTASVDCCTAITADGGSHILGDRTDDTTGIQFNLNPSGDPLYAGDSGTVIDRTGVQYTLGPFSGPMVSHYQGSSGPNQYTVVTYLERALPTLTEDRNGNKITGGVNDITGTGLGITDTLGRFFPGLVNTSDTHDCVSNYPTGSQIINFPGSHGGISPIKFCYSNFGINTGSMPGGAPASTTVPMLVTVVLPNGTNWNFNYDSYGNIMYIGLPTGGAISYTYTTISQCTPYNDFTTSNRAVASRIVDANDGTGPHTWTYNWAASGTQGGMISTVISPNGDDTVHVITPIANTCSLYETETQHFQGTGGGRQLLNTVDTQYSQPTGPSGTQPAGHGANVVPTVITTTMANGKVTQVQKDYASDSPGFIYGNVTEERDYDYGQGSPGPLLRKSRTSLLWQNNPAYYNLGMLDLPASTLVQDGGGNQVAYTTYNYDQTGLAASGITTQHDASPPTGSSRGNLTSVSHWLNTTNGWITSTTSYFDTGTVYQSTDPRGYTTTFSHDPAFAGAYVTQTQMPDTASSGAHHITQAWYDFNTGLKSSATDENNQTTAYSYDNMWRLTSVIGPPDPNNGNQQAQTAYGYNDTPYTPGSNTPYVYQQDKIDANNQTTSWIQYDGLGRVIRTAKFNGETDVNGNPDQNHWVDDVDTCYDGAGRKQYQTYPYQGPGWLPATYHCPPQQSTPYDTFSYDALGRLLATTKFDGGQETTGYSNFPLVITNDEASRRRRQSQTDALGRLIKIWEPDPATPLSFINETDYQYDPLGNLTRVDQMGNDPSSANWRSRTFQYDSLSRLTHANNPESGTINYAYDNNSNLISKISPAPNQTLGATVTTAFNYDELNRVAGKSYSSGGGVVYLYDLSTLWGIPIQNGIGRLSAEYNYAATGNGDSVGFVNSYDVAGRSVYELQFNQRVPAQVNKEFHYAYNLDGSLKSITYPSGRVVNYGYNVGQRPISAVDSNNISFAANAHYTAWGALSSVVNAKTSSFAGIATTNSYDARMQPVFLSASSPTQTVMSLGYDFFYGQYDNGDVYQVINNKDSSRSVQFWYDFLDRLGYAGTSHSANWGTTYTYDAWGNLLQRSKNNGSMGTEPLLNVSVNGKNQVTNWCYDTAGNIVDPNQGCPNSPPSSYPNVYDAENRLAKSTIGAGTTSYDYDADGRRVKKLGNVNTLYWYGAGGVLEETDLSGNLQNEYVFFSGKRTARYSATSGYSFYFSDHLGSANVVTDALGNIKEESDYYPFGGERQVIDAGIGNHYKFTGKERDPETGCDYFGARYYCNTIGRFITPDWAAKPTAVPYASFGNPQSLNLYSYVKNNPTTFGDPDGHCPDGDSCDDVHVDVAAREPRMMENTKVGTHYASGTGTITSIKFTNSSGAPISGLSVKETPTTKDNLTGKSVAGTVNPGSVSTNSKGQIGDVVMAPLRYDSEPHTFSKEDSAEMKAASTTLPYDHTTTQNLTFTMTDANGQASTCEASYSENLSNVDSEGNLNMGENSQGVNFTFATTEPVVKQKEGEK